MNTLQITTGFRKEMWEFKKTLVWVPIIIASLMIIAPLLQLLLLEQYQSNNIMEVLSQIANAEETPIFAKMAQGAISAMFMPFIMVSLLIQLYYFNSCLFDERRDLSVLFWRSLPVSDAQSIAIKLATGALVIPAIFMLAATAVLVVAIVVLLIACTILATSFDISLWHLWGQAEILSTLTAFWLNLLPYSLWLFPVFAWIMLTSVFASKAPILWAILPIAIVLLVEAFVVAYFRLNSSFFANILIEYMEFSVDMFPRNAHDTESHKFILFSVLSEKISVVAPLIGAGLMYATYWLRVNRSHS